MSRQTMIARLRYLMAVALLAAAYTLAGKLGLMLAFVHPSATAVWVPSGLALAAMLLWGYRLWPGIFVGAFVVNILTAGSAATTIGIATGNTLEGVFGAYLIHRFAGGRRVFDRAEDVFKFAVLAGMLSTTVSATMGVTSLSLGGFASWTEFGPIWITWWFGDLVGDLVVAPLLVLWKMEPRPRWNRAQLIEAILSLLGLAAFGGIVFAGLLPPPITRGYLFTALLFWIAFRYGRRETSTVTFILAGIAIWGTLQGHGPFVGATPHESLMFLQAFMGINSVLALAFAAAVAEHRKDEQSRAQLAAIVESSDDAIIGKTMDGIILNWNKGAERIFGYAAEEIIGQSAATLIPPERHGEEQDIIARLKRGERIEHYETVRRRKDGRSIHVWLTVSPMKDPRGAVIGASQVARDVTDRKHAEQQRETLIAQLEDALANVKVLRGLLPICSYCKKIRDDQGYWSRIEQYIHSHSEADFTHGICPQCMEKYYPKLSRAAEKKKSG